MRHARFSDSRDHGSLERTRTTSNGVRYEVGGQSHTSGRGRGRSKSARRCWRWTVSRVLSRTSLARRAARIIRLGPPLPTGSSTLTRTLQMRASPREHVQTGRLRQCPYSSLLREGFASPPVTRLSRVGSYPTISTLPLRARRRAGWRCDFCCTFPEVALGGR